MHRIALFALMGALTLTACDTADPEPDPVPLTTTLVEDVAADPGTRDNQGQSIDTGQYTFFDLDANEIVLNFDEADRSDSLSGDWDIAFRSTNILVNGGPDRTGNASAIVLGTNGTQPVAFSDLTEAPAQGYRQDGVGECPAVNTPGGTFPGSPRAICAGSDNGWYNYNGQINLVSAIPGRTIVVQTTEGDYAKIRVLSYYQGNPATPITAFGDPNADVGRYYTFEYVLQPDGSRGFETTIPEED